MFGWWVAWVCFTIAILLKTFLPCHVREPHFTELPENQLRSNDHRIVKYPNSEYAIQYYFETPGWHNFSGRYPSKDVAQKILDEIEKPTYTSTKPEVVSGVSRQRD